MRIATLFLVAFVAGSNTQRFGWPHPLSAGRYQPYVVADRYFVDGDVGFQDQESYGRQEALSAAGEGRNRPGRQRLGFLSNFLLPSFGNAPSFGNLAPFNTVTIVSSTSYVTVTSTLTTVRVTTCLPSTFFVNQFAAASTCLRRRRRGVPILGLYDDEDDHVHRDQIAASAVQPIETSALPTPVEVRRLYEERPASEIRSSRDDVDHSDDVVVVLPASYRSARPVFFGQQQQQQRQQQQQQPPLLSVLFPSNSPQTVTMSFTATTTVFSFTDTIVKKTLNLVAPPPEGVGGPLTCLPMGFVVC